MEKIQCVGFIMDGNRRWATREGRTTLEGHTRGYETLVQMIEVVHTAGIPHMVCYAFSTENWKRSDEEVGHLMELLRRGIEELSTRMKHASRKGNVRVIGERTRLSPDLVAAIDRVESENVSDPELTIWLAISYGGRAEIVAAANRAIAQGVPVTEETFAQLLYTHGMPDPDLIIRTSGEERISNFLLWQSAYSEFFFTKTLWPDFGESEFRAIVTAYEAGRHRRKGK